MVAISVLLSTSGNAQIKNAKTETVKIYGNCGMCETTIEKIGTLKNSATVDWNQQTQMATLTYDANKTNKNEILKKIALAGYDSDSFLAPTEAYNKLPGCCQYDRVAKVATSEENVNQNSTTENIASETQKNNTLQLVFDGYFELKDALVQTNGENASLKAKKLATAINEVKMDQLDMKVHMVWMKVLEQLNNNAKQISATKEINKQRDYFMNLSTNIYEIIKVSKTDAATYYQFCPMANDGKGANWLSKEIAIKNPYYGSQMLTCGKTVETINYFKI